MSTPPRTLNRFRVEVADESFILVLEDSAGESERFTASAEHLDVLADLIDDALGTASDG